MTIDANIIEGFKIGFPFGAVFGLIVGGLIGWFSK
jgi:hypothetical protein